MRRTVQALAIAASLGTPAAAEVSQRDPGGWVSSHSFLAAAPPARVWDTLAHPATWWLHSWSGDRRNMTLDLAPGGCWCERWAGGAAEHMRVVQFEAGKSLRMRGALGPLQAGAVTGVLTISLAAEGQGTRVTARYVVGGYLPEDLDEIAASVDAVLAEAFAALKQTAEAPAQ